MTDEEIAALVTGRKEAALKENDDEGKRTSESGMYVRGRKSMSGASVLTMLSPES